jgi:HAD superfamily hydrolase (TIGR01450 family)
VSAKIWGTFDVLLADLDGVVYEGKNAIDGAPETLANLKSAGIPIGYVTNNSSRNSETIASQLAGFGIDASADDVIGSGQIGVELLATLIDPGSKVLVVGGEGLRSRVLEGGFEIVPSADDSPAGVIQGFAPDVAWRDLAEAAFSIQRGAKWVATNSDWTLPQERGLAPGNGTLVSAVHTAVGQLPLVAGKPEPAIFNAAVKHFGAQSALFVGDRIDTDITGANRAGLASALVLTGVSTRKEVLGVKPEGRPNFILENLRELVEGYEAPRSIKNGFECLDARVELKKNVLKVTSGDPRGIGALRAACAAVYSSPVPIYGLEIPAELYE